MTTNAAVITTHSTEDFLALIRTATREVVREELSGKRRSTANNAISPDDEILERKQAAEMLGVSLTTLTTWVKDGILPDHKKGRRRYFLKSELYECIRRPS
jgi:excisionase family DNA binding protein